MKVLPTTEFTNTLGSFGFVNDNGLTPTQKWAESGSAANVVSEKPHPMYSGTSLLTVEFDGSMIEIWSKHTKELT